MLPASDLAEILTNLAALNLQPNTVAAVLGAVLAPLLRNDPALPVPSPKRAVRPVRLRARNARKKSKRRAARPTDARVRARAALKANPDATLTAVAKLAKVSRSTVVNARDELAAEARKRRSGEPSERQDRAQRFLREQLGRGPKPVSDVEAAAEKAHVDPQALAHARVDLGVVTSRANTGGAHAVQWSLPS